MRQLVVATVVNSMLLAEIHLEQRRRVTAARNKFQVAGKFERVWHSVKFCHHLILRQRHEGVQVHAIPGQIFLKFFPEMLWNELGVQVRSDRQF